MTKSLKPTYSVELTEMGDFAMGFLEARLYSTEGMEFASAFEWPVIWA